MAYSTAPCPGYLSSREGFECLPIAAVLDQEINNLPILDPVDQYKLAERIALSLLQYHDTQWLDKDWRLHNYDLLRSEDERWGQPALETLHLNTVIKEVVTPNALIGKSQAVEVLTPEQQYGINNMSLFSLGIALLEISFRKPIESLSEMRDDPILLARRLARTYTPLGPRYRRIVERCLQCTFCEETDLSKPRLRDAVYQHVILELNSMVESLSLED